MKINTENIIENRWNSGKTQNSNKKGLFDEMLSDAVDELGVFPQTGPPPVNKMSDAIVDGIRGSFEQVSSLQADAKQQMIDFAAGRSDSVHEVMISVQKAKLTFDLVMGIRNKVISGFKEIMKMPI